VTKHNRQSASLGPAHDPLDAHEQQQQGQADDHLGHDQWGIDHGSEQGTAFESCVTHQHISCESTQNHCDAGADQRYFQRQEKAFGNA
jgi:hypothetical protein